MGHPESVLPVSENAQPARQRGWTKPLFAVLATFLLVPVLYPSAAGRFMDAVGCPHRAVHLKENPNKHAGNCAQPDVLHPSFDVSGILEGKKEQIITWLSDAVKIPTEIFDVMGEIGEDKRWDVFYEFADCALELSRDGMRWRADNRPREGLPPHA